MGRLEGTLKLPDELVEEYASRLIQSGVQYVDVTSIPYEQFVRESRLNYDCSFPQMWTDKKSVSYLKFSFEDSPEGRKAAFETEYRLMQVPMNLRYSY